MISEHYRNVAEKQYLSQSKDKKKLDQIMIELEKFILDTIINKFPKRVLNYVANYPDKVKLQKDIDLSYTIDMDYRIRYYVLPGVLTLHLGSVMAPLFLGNPNDALKKDGRFYTENTEFCNKFQKYIKTIKTLTYRIISNVTDLRKALSASSMNKTSIEKFYPELFKLMYGNEEKV